MAKMSLKPNINKKALEAFISEPDRKNENKDEKKTNQTNAVDDSTLPWEEVGVTERVKHFVQVRLPEPLKLKMDWIVKNSLKYSSMQNFCIQTISDKIESELKEMLK